MKSFFLIFVTLINFFNSSSIAAEGVINPANNKIDNITKKESISEDKNEIRKIHIVKIGDIIFIF